MAPRDERRPRAPVSWFMSAIAGAGVVIAVVVVMIYVEFLSLGGGQASGTLVPAQNGGDQWLVRCPRCPTEAPGDTAAELTCPTPAPCNCESTVETRECPPVVTCSCDDGKTGASGSAEEADLPPTSSFPVPAVEPAARLPVSGWRDLKLDADGISSWPLPKGNEASTTVILNLFRRPTYLERQLESILVQTVSPSAVWVCMFAVDAKSKPSFDASVAKYRDKMSKAGISLRVIQSDINFKYYGRFQLALQAETRFIWTVDDDIIPGKQFLEQMLRVMGPVGQGKVEAGLLGSSGWVLRVPDQASHGGWKGPKLVDYYGGQHLLGQSKLKEADFLTTQQFTERTYLRHLFREEIESFASGEDLILAHAVRRYAERRVYIMPCGSDRNKCGTQSTQEWEKMTQDGAQTTTTSNKEGVVGLRNRLLDTCLYGGGYRTIYGPSFEEDHPVQTTALSWTPDSVQRKNPAGRGGVLLFVPSVQAASSPAVVGLQDVLWGEQQLWLHVLAPRGQKEPIQQAMKSHFGSRAFGWFKYDNLVEPYSSAASAAGDTLRVVGDIIRNTRPDALLVLADFDAPSPPSPDPPSASSPGWGVRRSSPPGIASSAIAPRFPPSFTDTAPELASTSAPVLSNHLSAAAALAASIHNVPILHLPSSTPPSGSYLPASPKAVSAQLKALFLSPNPLHASITLPSP